jgi:hypothetical protein
VNLANSSNSDILIGLGDRPGSDMTARLLLALTALYVERPTHTREEQQQYLELALRLVDKVDAATRAAVAGILRRHPDAPGEIFERLSDVEPARIGEGANAQDTLASTAQTIAAAPAAGPDTAILTPLPPPSELGEAFFAASATERRQLLAQLAAEPEDVAGSTDVADPAALDQDRTGAPDNGEPVYRKLDAAAMQGRIGEFTREFERLVAMPKSLCQRILNDGSGEPMVVAAKAADMPIAVLQRILLLVNPAVSHSVQRVYDLTDLYHALDRGAALRLVALWRAQAKPNDPTADGKPDAGERKSGLRDTSVAGLRSRFSALTERIQGQANQGQGSQGQGSHAQGSAAPSVNVRPGPGSVARRDLRSR